MLAVVLDARGEQLDGLRYPSNPLRRIALGRFDPTQVPATVELGEPVEELASLRVGRQRGRYVLGEVSTLRPFRFDLKLDLVPHEDATVTRPRRAQQKTPLPVVSLDDAAYPAAVDRTADVVTGLVRPYLIRVERHR
jgi:hypothetical protein